MSARSDVIKKITAGWAVATFGFVASMATAESLLAPVNELGIGTVGIRARTITMYRDYEGTGNNYATSLGWKLDWLSPEFEGFSAGVSYIRSDVLHSAGRKKQLPKGEFLLQNGRVNVLNEAWVQYRFEVIQRPETFIKAGRQVINGEVFRADEARHKPRSFEAVVFTTKDTIPDTELTVGHIDRISNIWGFDGAAPMSWRFKDAEKVLGGEAYRSTRGISWAEVVNRSVEDLELVAYSAYAYNLAKMGGGRVRYALSDSTALNGYYRHERDAGSGPRYRSDMLGLSVSQKIGAVNLEPGYFSVSGKNLKFQQARTGINHPMGSSMMIYANHFDGGADTAYLRMTTTIRNTSLYALYNYTWHDNATMRAAEELNVVVSHPLTERLTVALRGGVGYRDWKNQGNTTATDARVFLTYQF